MANTSSNEEEDYMSEAFIAKCTNDVRPGLVSKTVARQYQNEARHRELNAVHRAQHKPRAQLETEQRDEGLKNALTAENKGFKLLQKMGYKPGTAIGKRGVGKTEPIPLEVKCSREGLGGEAERKRKMESARAMRAVMARKRQRHELEWKQTVRAKVACREAERDLRRSQQVCEQLDNTHDVDVPERKFYWPPELLPQRDEDPEQEEDLEQEQEDEETEADDELAVEQKLEILTHYLRLSYYYCVWCGTTFNDESDMLSSCPGDTADDHS